MPSNKTFRYLSRAKPGESVQPQLPCVPAATSWLMDGLLCLLQGQEDLGEEGQAKPAHSVSESPWRQYSDAAGGSEQCG